METLREAAKSLIFTVVDMAGKKVDATTFAMLERANTLQEEDRESESIVLSLDRKIVLLVLTFCHEAACAKKIFHVLYGKVWPH